MKSPSSSSALEKIFKVGIVIIALFVLLLAIDADSSNGLSLVAIMYMVVFFGLPLAIIVGLPLAIAKMRDEKKAIASAENAPSPGRKIIDALKIGFLVLASLFLVIFVLPLLFFD